MADKTVTVTVTAEEAELVMDLVGMVLQANHIGGELGMSAGLLTEVLPSDYAQLDSADQDIFDQFLMLAGHMPIQVTAVAIHLRDDWDTMDLTDG